MRSSIYPSVRLMFMSPYTFLPIYVSDFFLAILISFYLSIYKNPSTYSAIHLLACFLSINILVYILYISVSCEYMELMMPILVSIGMLVPSS